MSTKPSKRCPYTNLTLSQTWVLLWICLPSHSRAHKVPAGVYRSLVCRGLLTSAHAITQQGRVALERCELLSEKLRKTLLR